MPCQAGRPRDVGTAEALRPTRRRDLSRVTTSGVGEFDMRAILCLLLCCGAMAGEPPLFTDQEWGAAPAATTPAAAPGWGAVAGLGIGVVLVLGAAIGLGWLARRLNARRLLGQRGRQLELLETIQLAPRRQLALVRCAGQWLVVGIGERELSAIATLPAPAEAPAAPPPSAFAGELARLVAVPPAAEPRP